MEILSIGRRQETEKEIYTSITFRTWFGREYTEICITPKATFSTIYAKNGKSLPFELWDIVKAFLRTEEKEHVYSISDVKL